MRKKKRVITGVSCTAVALGAWIAFCGYQWSWLFMPKSGATTIWESWEGTSAQGGIPEFCP